jgi:hypothetical protein
MHKSKYKLKLGLWFETGHYATHAAVAAGCAGVVVYNSRTPTAVTESFVAGGLAIVR